MTKHPDQFRFDALLENAAAENRQHRFQRDTAHLPSTMEAAIPFHLEQIDAHHAAMLACDFKAARAIRKEAHNMAQRLNDGKPGILATEDAPGNVLSRECAAAPGAVPLWGQAGQFVLEAAQVELIVDIEGIFSIGATVLDYPGFEVWAKHLGKEFLSCTGYRSFLGCSAPGQPNLSVADFVCQVVEHYISVDLKVRLVPIGDEFR